MTHKACHFSVSVISRADGRSAVSAAAYRAGDTYTDDRTGRSHSYRSKSGVLSHELINWTGTVEDLWNAAEAAEKRRDARVAREITISLPAELRVSDQRKLVRGFGLWLRDTYRIALQTNIHGPRWDSKKHAEKAEAALLARDENLYRDLVLQHSNRNIHVHIMGTTRSVEDGAFGGKTRVLDDKKTGPADITRMRQEWDKRVNAVLRQHGVSERVDLRSYADQAAAGDAPVGLVAQPHLGPRRAARERAGSSRTNAPHAFASRRRETANRNREIWECWLSIRARQRELARLRDSAARAADAERERRTKAQEEKARLASARSAEDIRSALIESTQVHAVRPDCPLTQAIAAARAGQDLEAQDAFAAEVDLEADPPISPPKQMAAPAAHKKLQRARNREAARGR